MDQTLRALLHELHQFGVDNDAIPRPRHEKMLNISPDTGELLAILVRATKSRSILEIGTSNGYSTLWLAQAVEPLVGSVVTIESSAAKAELARRNFDRSG